MIVRDEEAFLAACLATVSEHVDEIVVVDTGSTDATVEIAQSFGARVMHVGWRDNFAAARNASLRMATGDWALVLDADERLEDGAAAREAIDRFVAENPGRIGRIERIEEPSGERNHISRLLPLDGLHEFTGRVHEQIVFALGEPLRADVGVVARHFGYVDHVVASRDKNRRYRTLLEREIADRPDDPYAWYQLGRTLYAADDIEGARGALERAHALVASDASYLPHLVETLAYCLRGLGRPTEGLRLMEPLVLRFGARTDTQFVAALLALDLGHIERARRGFLRCLEPARPDAPTPGGPHDPTSAGVAPAHNLGVMAEVLGRAEEARQWYERALAFEPGHGPASAGLERVRSAA